MFWLVYLHAFMAESPKTGRGRRKTWFESIQSNQTEVPNMLAVVPKDQKLRMKCPEKPNPGVGL